MHYIHVYTVSLLLRELQVLEHIMLQGVGHTPQPALCIYLKNTDWCLKAKLEN